MANVFVLCLTLYQVTGIVSETSFHQGMLAQRPDDSDQTFSAQHIDSFPHYSWEDNVISSSERSETDLHSINQNVLRLQQLIFQQSDLIQFLISGQDELSKENSKWIKRYKSTRKYLRKLNRACVFRPSETDYVIKPGLGIPEKLTVKPEAHISKFSNHVHNKRNDNIKANTHSAESKPTLSEIIKSIPFTENESMQLNKQVKMEVGKFERPHMAADSYDPLLEILPFKGDTDEDTGLEIDLTNGQIQGKDLGITWEENLVFGQNVKCGLLGVIKIDLQGLNSQSLVVDMRFDSPAGSVFNMANSPSREKTIYEVRGYNDALEVSSRLNNDSLVIIYYEEDSIATRLTLLFNNKGISRKLATGNFKQINNTGVVSTVDTLYLSMNRVIAPGGLSTSSGLCKVKLNWLQQ
ncbi:hypothetical protein LOTGIDRAFT_165982 [Lottia gigantea]|uniref:Jacalin-type lectin domain-containing protein n=1 Tax=Lottia gigantea TaxID=225164 RepID=V4A3Z6_LOTGI|nr:hypothetical protein LOTGIDRAFT_165982 [Lottia gigantea]ESO87956.1 hypothetical protein LOTGIDRAFT_165982 [Lottia gigantea]